MTMDDTMQEANEANGRLADVLKQRFGHDGFLPMQEGVIENVLAGRDSLVLMPTGSGKSVCYQLPALLLDGVTLVVSPLIALMKDQVDSLKSKGIRAAFINSAMTYPDVRAVQADAYRGRLDILYVSPERLAIERFSGFLRALKLGLIAIDEAHCISEWGHDFRPDYRNLQTLRDDFQDTPMIALTATATERVREDIVQQLRMPGASRFVASFNRPNLTYTVRPKRKSFQALVDLLGRLGAGSAIVYRFSRQETEDLASRLAGRGFRALPYHAGLEDEVRRKTQERFLGDDVPIIVATIAFGMGVDKPNIRLVVHYDLPKTIEGYYQETGRAGRDGRPSDCVLFFSYGDKMKQEFFIGQMEDDAERANAEAKLAKMVEYGSTKSCRRRSLLGYFGEEWTPDNCGACDVCLAEQRRAGPDGTFDGTKVVQKVLSAVIRTGERFGANHVVEVLRGSRSSRVLALGHDRLSVYGIAREMPTDDLKDIIDQLIGMGLVERAPGEFPTLSVTPGGRRVLKDRETVTLVGQVAAPVPQGDPAAPHDQALFQKLRVLRKRLADSLGIPAYVVFSDDTLRQLASSMPGDRASMLKVKGVGEAKLRQFGDEFLSVIAGHVAGTGDKRARTPSPVATSGVSQISSSPADAPSVRVPTPVEKLLSHLVGRPVTIAQEDLALHRTLQNEVAKVLQTLREREAHVVTRRFGLEDDREQTLHEIGNCLGVSGERVRQIEKRALRKLRHPSRIRSLQGLLEATTTTGDLSDSSGTDRPRLNAESGSYLNEVRRFHQRAYEPWSPLEQQQLKDLLEAGQSIDEIASTLKRQPSAIRSRLEHSGLSPHESPSHITTLDLVRAGLSITEISHRRGIREQTVLTHLERLTSRGHRIELAHLMPESPRYERIVQAFTEVGSEHLKPVKETLGEEYSYDELRIVRMQMRQSDQGNVNRST